MTTQAGAASTDGLGHRADAGAALDAGEITEVLSCERLREKVMHTTLKDSSGRTLGDVRAELRRDLAARAAQRETRLAAQRCAAFFGLCGAIVDASRPDAPADALVSATAQLAAFRRDNPDVVSECASDLRALSLGTHEVQPRAG